MKSRYAEDKTEDCRRCYFWKGSHKGCSLERKCYYLVAEAQKKKSECQDCPYGSNYSCIGWCTKMILRKEPDKECGDNAV